MNTLTKEQENSIQNYKRLGIVFTLASDDTVIVKQERLINGYLLSQKQLVTRAREIFPTHKLKPVVYCLNLKSITPEWILEQMAIYKLNKKDLIKQLAIKKEDLYKYIEENPKTQKTIPAPTKALFFYYFLSYEINASFREEETKNEL